MNKPFDQLHSLLQIIYPQAKLLSVSKLEGGISARVFLLEVGLPGGSRPKWVLRQYGKADLAGNPHIARDEFQLLQALHKSSLPAARPVAFAENLKHPLTPCLLLEHLPGETDFSPQNLNSFITQAANHLWKIHSTDIPAGNFSFLPQADKLAEQLIFKGKETRAAQPLVKEIRQELQKRWPFLCSNPPVLLHGDFWPGNLLWANGQLSGIIDWEDARLGDPLADLANARLEFLWAFDRQAMIKFTESYLKISGIKTTNLVIWDALAALRNSGFLNWGLPDTQKQKMKHDFDRFLTETLQGIRTNF